MKNRIKALREALGLSQQELADKSGLTAPTISRLERDTREMSRGTRRALAQALGVSEGGLFAENDAAEHPSAAVPAHPHEAEALQPLLVLCKTIEELIRVEEFALAAATASALAERCRERADRS
jgi:transcriptional regulator with XRE-family HTH domain